jgi:hypothetical protein
MAYDLRKIINTDSSWNFQDKYLFKNTYLYSKI